MCSLKISSRPGSSAFAGTLKPSVSRSPSRTWYQNFTWPGLYIPGVAVPGTRPSVPSEPNDACTVLFPTSRSKRTVLTTAQE